MKLNIHIAILRKAVILLTAGLCTFASYAADVEVGKSAEPPDGFEPIRMTVRTNGVYYIDADTIATLMAVNTNEVKDLIASGGVTLRNMGADLGYLPDTEGAGIYFFGQALDSTYSDENIYWLRWYDGNPVSLPSGQGPALASTATESMHTQHYEQDLLAGINFIDDIEDDYWTWDYIISEDVNLGTNSYVIDVSNIAIPGSIASLKVNLVGVTSSGTDLEHHAVISINGTEIGEGIWTGVNNHEFDISFSQGLLSEGTNTITVAGILDSGAIYSIFRIDSFDLTYERTHIAINDEAVIQAGDNQILTVDGFTQSTIYSVSLLGGDSMQNMPDSTVSAGPTYRVSFMPEDNITYVIFGAAGNPAPDSAEAVELGTLKTQSGDSHHVIITVPEFDSAAQSLADYRGTKGLKSEVIHIEDIYNDFNYGIATPWAIRDFLMYTSTNWAEAVEYVVLAGEGTYDYKDLLGNGDNIIPTAFVSTPQGLFSSDNVLADFNDDHIPDVAIGRLPVMTNDELQNIVDKIISYENTAKAAWQQHVVLVADKEDNGGAFHKSSAVIEPIIPETYTTQTIYRIDYDAVTVSTMLEQSLNNGAAFINFFGHGAVDRLSKDNILNNTDISSLNNSNKLAILTSMSCVMGQYSSPHFDCLGETLLLGSASGVGAVWAPSGASINQAAETLCKEFYESVFVDNKTVIGDAVIKALSDYSNENRTSYLLDIYNLMGDPAMKIMPFYASYSYIYSEWENDVFTPQQLAAPDTTDWDDDPDGDGIVNLAEYAFMSNPNSANGKQSVLSIDDSKPVGEPSEAYDMVITFLRRRGLGDVTFLVEASFDFVTWSSDPEWIIATEIVENEGDDSETVSIYVKSPEAGRDKAFVRLRLIKN